MDFNKNNRQEFLIGFLNDFKNNVIMVNTFAKKHDLDDMELWLCYIHQQKQFE